MYMLRNCSILDVCVCMCIPASVVASTRPYIYIRTYNAGPPDESDSFTHDLRGVIPRSFEYLFSLINREKQKVSILLYNSTIIF